MMAEEAALNFADFYDAELARHNAHFRVAAAVGRSDRVLDIGCGAGQTTRDAARAAEAGRAHGIDLSVTMLEIARRRSAEEGLPNATFELANAQNHHFVKREFDLCISRFGVMFFADPAVAFANIANAIRPGGRFIFMVWQGRDHNEWATAIHKALDPDSTGPVAASKAFSLSEPSVTSGLLETAGFTAIEFREINEPVFYGPDPETALATIQTFENVKNALDRPATTAEIRARLLDMLEEHQTPHGIQFDSRAWLITGRRHGDSPPCLIGDFRSA
ncbi:class I SAM-dependent methyltransferase [Rhizobium leguminosarum]|uniref:class I SAM-dependent methyltransferase n=1 Tax=Rhizobium leguminosarum TaxID=384 RepID=UPI001C97F1F2|nr:class I SAM-dependent methyltransferase [Rhizobium leguminosarum]MBY5542406.1 class I SAM-dependent methyltransferase [Rhizobium leguminosarum]